MFAKIVRFVKSLFLFALSVFFIGFFVFLAQIQRYDVPSTPGAQGVVVFTGGADRIETALRLLEQKAAPRLLISGVDVSTSKLALNRIYKINADLLECCVDIDRVALDTIGNAEETVRWSKKHDYRSLIVVTSAYHMPRSLLELSRRTTETLVPYPVKTDIFDAGGWFFDADVMELLLREYLKNIIALGQYSHRY